LRTTEGRYDQSERRGQAVAEVRGLLARLYRGFVWWGSLYEDADLLYEQERRREEVVGLLGEFSGNYLARSVWLEGGNPQEDRTVYRQVGGPVRGFRCGHIVNQGYARTRPAMANRVSKELGSLRKEAEASLEDELAGARHRGWRLRR
jgi:hypothetical protein